jgi:hypothetical protein
MLGRWNLWLSMNIAVLILLLSFGVQSVARFIRQNKAEVSKRQYSSKAKGSNVRDFFVTKSTVPGLSNRKRSDKTYAYLVDLGTKFSTDKTFESSHARQSIPSAIAAARPLARRGQLSCRPKAGSNSGVTPVSIMVSIVVMLACAKSDSSTRFENGPKARFASSSAEEATQKCISKRTRYSVGPPGTTYHVASPNDV